VPNKIAQHHDQLDVDKNKERHFSLPWLIALHGFGDDHQVGFAPNSGRKRLGAGPFTIV